MLGAMNRRAFFKTSTVGGSSLLLARAESPASAGFEPALAPPPPLRPTGAALPDLTPARWIWYPSGRTLQNTFLLFRRDVHVPRPLRRATGWIAADSRYRLDVNGQRVQWGPSPSDPRWAEADPLDLTAVLQAGPNTFGATVLFYGTGDGTWPIGKPGFLFWLELEYADGLRDRVVTDASWHVLLCRAWRPGQFKRWYLRALQEEFDARLYPEGWCRPGFSTTPDWLPAMPLPGSPNRPALSTGYYEYQLDVGGGPAGTQLRPRSIPLLQESLVPVRQLTERARLRWIRSPQEYFEMRPPSAFQVVGETPVTTPNDGAWQVELDGQHGILLTFELAEQVVGWPFFTLEAAAGTTVELLVHEAHRPGGPPLLNTHFDSWTRFICRAGVNRFETFDFESLRWLQLHLHGPAGPVVVSQLGVRRRQFPWPHPAHIVTREPGLQRLFQASLNTLHNSAQETLVDGMARERQQYSGDGGHQLHAVHLAFGETRLPARFITTFSQGMTKDGFFLDCWPAFDRLARLMERQLDLTGWGPILDHGVGFNFDCWHHWQYAGRLDDLAEAYPRLVRFARYLQALVGPDGLLPVEDLGIPSVWIDHVAYEQQRHKQCAFNLYAAAMLQHALAPICRAFGHAPTAAAVTTLGQRLQAATVRRFWNDELGLFVNNLPWLAEDGHPRTCDRSLATAILFDQCPDGRNTEAVRSLADCPPEMGFSYPCNAGWRLWALAQAGRPDIILRDLRTRWATMTSVIENNTLQEDWEARHDSGQQWSHCAVAPLYLAFHGLMGLRPLEPGFRRMELRPQLADLEHLDLIAHTVQGPIRLTAEGPLGRRVLSIQTPANCRSELILPAGESPDLPRLTAPTPAHTNRFSLPADRTVTLRLTRT